nr:sugar diacid recognition domain-containing protein [Scopulibacillus darangshiensis]
MAQNIIEKTSEILEFPISMTDERGNIIGCTDPNRVGTLHQSSLDVIKRNDMISYYPEEVNTYPT